MLKAIAKFYPVLRPMIGMAIAGCLLALATAFAQIALLAVSGWFIGAMALAGIAGLSMNYFAPAAIIRALAIVRTAGRYAERLSTHDATLRFVAALRPWLFMRICRLSAARQDRIHSGSMFDMLRADIDHLEKFYLNGFLPLLVAVASVFSASVLLGFYQAYFAIALFFALMICGIVAPYLVWRVSRDAATALSKQALTLKISAINTLDGMGDLLVCGRAEEKLQDLFLRQSGYVSLHRDVQQSEAAGAVLQSFLISALSFTFLGAGFWFFENGNAVSLHPALLAALPLLIISCVDVLSPVPAALNAWESASYAVSRLKSVIEEDIGFVSKEQKGGDLTLSTVTFRYEGAAVDALKNISFVLPAGESMAISGASGAGKSTLVDIISGVREPVSGSIAGGGLSRVAVAEQRPYVFAGTLRSNILLGCSDATTEEFEKSCQASEFDEVAALFKDGYDARLGTDGIAALSGGQMRRLSIARALLKKADYLLLDEPDDGLDPLQVARMIDKIKATCRVRGQGLIVVTHNLTVLKKFDRALYLEQGQRAVRPQNQDMIVFS